MAKRITSTYHEPMVVHLLCPKGTLRVAQRTTVNLLPGESITEYPPGVPIEELSPEAEKLRRKGYVQVEDIEVSAPETTTAVAPEPTTQQGVEDEIDEIDPNYDENLERQLLEENE